ncbi:hypothetical protein [Halomonas sp. BC04]|uniref:hypothetical protein n=1 Tax=Halomonas sp. BC04 TaxID=1403540 RepID=UPI0003ED8AB7|nr:hypothetical protein [Halomonas sp. BC04]EWH00455.1 hypothetical protein Q427_19325 [Halomonas sp. BC04]
MKRIIRDVAQLPDWFEVEPYTLWPEKDLYEAAYAISDRFFFWRFSEALMYEGEGRKYTASEKEISTALEQLANGAKRPYERFAMEPMVEIFKVQRSIHQDPEVAAKLDDRDRKMRRCQSRPAWLHKISWVKATIQIEERM